MVLVILLLVAVSSGTGFWLAELCSGSVFSFFQVSLAYGAEVPPLEKDNRRETREVFHTQPTELASGFRLHPGDQRSWNVK